MYCLARLLGQSSQYFELLCDLLCGMSATEQEEYSIDINYLLEKELAIIKAVAADPKSGNNSL